MADVSQHLTKQFAHTMPREVAALKDIKDFSELKPDAMKRIIHMLVQNRLRRLAREKEQRQAK